MRKSIIFTSVILFALISSLTAQWKFVKKFNDGRLIDIDFDKTSSIPQRGWILSLNDTIYITTNGGTSWTSVKSQTNGTPYAFKFINLNNNLIGLMVNSSVERAWKSTNGGNSWSPAPIPDNSNFMDIEFLLETGDHAWCVGANEKIYYSNNTGTSWKKQHSNSNALYGVDFVNRNCGWAVGESGTILHTINGSSETCEWKSQVCPVNADLYSVCFVSTSTGWTAGANGTILFTINGGNTWVIQSTTATENLYGISFIDNNNGAAVGENNIILHTVDGGNLWTKEPSPVIDNFIEVFYFDIENCWIIGYEHGNLIYSQGLVSMMLPDGGKAFETGFPMTITWESNYTKNVRIDLSTNNGITWDTTLTSQISAQNGIFECSTPNKPSKLCKIRIRSLKDSNVEDFSPPFEIFEKQIHVIKPRTGDKLVGGARDTIRWVHKNVEKINISLVVDDTPNREILSNIAAGDSSGRIVWEFPRDINNDRCQILIKETDGAPQAISGYFSIISDNEPPAISNVTTTPNIPHQGDSLIAIAKITDANTLSAFLFFRNVGDTEYQPQDARKMNPIGNDQYSATIYPTEATGLKIDERGLEWYIYAIDNSPAGNDITYKTPENPVYTPVLIDTMKFDVITSAPENPKWQMISIPYKLEDSSYSAVFKDFLPYDNSKWRVWNWSSSKNDYEEIVSGNFIQRGKSYFLAAVSEYSQFVTGKGISYQPQKYTMVLDTGWNQIANPFAFPILAQAILNSSGNPEGIQGFIGFNETEQNWDSICTPVLNPRVGYIIKNQTGIKYPLEIYPIAVQSNNPSTKKKIYFDEKFWQIRLKIMADQRNDNFNLIGVHPEASEAWDVLDYPEPPPIPGKYISLSFPHASWKKYPGNYTIDFRSIITTSATWQFFIKSNMPETIATLTAQSIENVPLQYKVYLIDESINFTQNLRQNQSYKFVTSSTNQTKQMEIVVGTQEYFDQAEQGFTEIPKSYELLPNFPNPFNSATTIRYGIPVDDKLSLTVYNIMGEKVITLFDQYKPAGYHVEIWDGCNADKINVGSGVYIYCLSSSKLTLTQKMILMK